jgi:hypothetical protein
MDWRVASRPGSPVAKESLGHGITDGHVQLARYLDEAYVDFEWLP